MHSNQSIDFILFVNKLYLINILSERFLIECRKIKTKVITSTNHNRHEQRNEPIRTRNKYRKIAVISPGLIQLRKGFSVSNRNIF